MADLLAKLRQKAAGGGGGGGDKKDKKSATKDAEVPRIDIKSLVKDAPSPDVDIAKRLEKEIKQKLEKKQAQYKEIERQQEKLAQAKKKAELDIQETTNRLGKKVAAGGAEAEAAKTGAEGGAEESYDPYSLMTVVYANPFLFFGGITILGIVQLILVGMLIASFDAVAAEKGYNLSVAPSNTTESGLVITSRNDPRRQLVQDQWEAAKDAWDAARGSASLMRIWAGLVLGVGLIGLVGVGTLWNYQSNVWTKYPVPGTKSDLTVISPTSPFPTIIVMLLIVLHIMMIVSYISLSGWAEAKDLDDTTKYGALFSAVIPAVLLSGYAAFKMFMRTRKIRKVITGGDKKKSSSGDKKKR